jgi:hypothetical protein
MIWVAGRSPTLVSHSLRGVAMNLKATTLTYLAIEALREFQDYLESGALMSIDYLNSRVRILPIQK